MTLLEQRAAMVTYIHPHPLVLVSMISDTAENIFPMHLMGDLGHHYVAFALSAAWLAGRLVRPAGRIAVSSVPLSWCPVAFKLMGNHGTKSIDWQQLPFALKMSAAFRIPVPLFATRVRELEVQKVFEMGNYTRKGSHTFFVARIVSDERISDDPPVSVVHGFYQCWRLRGQSAKLKASVAQDSLNKRV